MKRSPHVNFFIQKINIPGIELPPVHEPTPFVHLPHAGDHVTYEPLVATFLVDEDFKNWIEIHQWMRQLGKVENFQEYADLKKNLEHTGLGLRSEIIVTILSSHRNGHIAFTFHNCTPIALSKLDFDKAQTTVNYLTATVEFTYDFFDFERVS
jgi:hypothetical protein